MTEVFVVDDHAVLRSGIVAIAEKGGVRVAGETDSIAGLKQLLRARIPDAIIMDISMPGGSGLDALPEIKAALPATPVLILSMYPEEQYALRSIRLGASGYLSKQCAPEMLVKAIKTVVRGERFLTEAVADLLAGQLQNQNQSGAPHNTLSERELEVLMAIAQGKPLSAMARDAHLSVKTISTYRHRVLKKMGFETNADIIKYAINSQLLPR